MPRFIRDIIPPRLSTLGSLVRANLAKGGRDILATAQAAETRFEKRQPTSAHALKRLALFLFLIEPLLIVLVLALFGIFSPKLFTHAESVRVVAADCNGTFANSMLAQGAPDISENGNVGDFNELNSAYTNRDGNIECGQYPRIEKEYKKAKLTFVLGVRKNIRGGLLPTSEPVRTQQPTIEEPQIVPLPLDTATASTSVLPTENVSASAAFPSVIPALRPSEAESEGGEAGIESGMKKETSTPLEAARAHSVPLPLTGPTPAPSPLPSEEPTMSPISKLFHFLASLILPVYAQQQPASSDILTPSSSDILMPTPSDPLQPTPLEAARAHSVPLPLTGPSPSDALALSPSVTPESPPVIPASPSVIPAKAGIQNSDSNRFPTISGMTGGNGNNAELSAIPTSVLSPSAEESVSSAPQVLVPNIDAGLENLTTEAGDIEDFSFVDFVVRLQYAVGVEQWQTLEEITKATSNEIQNAELPFPSDEIIPSPERILITPQEQQIGEQGNGETGNEHLPVESDVHFQGLPLASSVIEGLSEEVTPTSSESAQPSPQAEGFIRRIFKSANAADTTTNSKIYYTYDLPANFTADDLEILKARVEVLVTQNANVEVFLDSVFIEVETEEDLLTEALHPTEVVSNQEPGDSRGTMIATLPAQDLTFKDHADNAKKRFRFASEHDGIRIEAAEKGNEKIGFRIEDTAAKKWLKLELTQAPISQNPQRVGDGEFALGAETLPRQGIFSIAPAQEVSSIQKSSINGFDSVSAHDNTLLFQIDQNLNAEYEVRNDRVKADYVLKQLSAISYQLTATNVPVLTFKLRHNFRLRNSQQPTTDSQPGLIRTNSGIDAGLEVESEESVVSQEGDIVFSGENGKEVFRMPVPKITDAAGKTVTGELVYDQKAGAITLTIPASFLETAVYPITIDPTVINTTSAANALINSGGRKIVADRYGNLIAVYLSATNTLTAEGSADGGITWVGAVNINTAVKNTAGFSIDMDSVSSVVHVAYANTSEDDTYYAQLRISYTEDGTNKLRAFTVPTPIVVINIGTTPDSLWAPIVIAARANDPGPNWFSDAGEFATSVPIVMSFSADSNTSDDSNIWYTICKLSVNRGIADCTAAANWLDDVADSTGRVCTGSGNTETNAELVSLSAAQTFPSKKVWLFAASNGTNLDACGAASLSLGYALAPFSGTSTWTFTPQALGTINNTAGASVRFRNLNALSDNTFTGGGGALQSGRAVVVYADGTANISAVIMDDTNTVTTTKVLEGTGLAEAGMVGEGQLALSSTAYDAFTATSARYWYYAVSNASGTSNTTSLWFIPRVLRDTDAWTKIGIFAGNTGNQFAGVAPYAVTSTTFGSYAPAKLNFIWLNTDPATDEITYSTWHFDETLFTTSVALAVAPSATASNYGIQTYADENDYRSVTSSDDTRLSMVNTAAFPVLTLRRLNPRRVNTDQIGVYWEGQTGDITTSVTIQIFKFRGLGGAGWKNLVTTAPNAVDIDFIISATTTNNFPVSGASITDYYDIDYTQGIMGNAMAMVRVFQGAGTATFRTDRFCSFCSGPPAGLPADETLDEVANLAAVSIVGDGTATSVHLQVDANDITGSTPNVPEADWNTRDGVFRTDTTNTATAYNAFLYRARQPQNDRRAMFTVEWVGKSSTTQMPVVLQVYKFRGSATGWRTIAGITPPGDDIVFSVSGTVFTASSTGYQMDNFYSNDLSGDITGTSVIAVRVYQQRVNCDTSCANTSLYTDTVTTTFGFIGLAQQSFRFMNDNGATPDENTSSSSPDTAIIGVRKGERLNLRIQVTATTTSGFGQIPLVRKNFRLQYVAANSPSVDCSTFADTYTATAVHPVWQFVGVGEDPTGLASISPTSINVSRSLSGYHGQRLTTLKTAALPAGVTQRSGLFVESQDGIVATSVIDTSVDYFALGPDQGTELSYAIHTGGAINDATFCFRLVMDDLGQAVQLTNYAVPTTVKFTAYEVYPKLTVRTATEDTQRYSKGEGQHTTDAFTGMTDKITPSWGAEGSTYGISYDSFTHTIYVGGGTGTLFRFGKYDPASDTFTDLTSKITPSWGTGGQVSVLAYDAFNHVIYVGGRDNSATILFRFGKYDPASDTFTDLTSKITPSWGTIGNFLSIPYDAFNHVIYVGGRDDSATALFRFGKYDPASDTFTDLTSKITPSWGTGGYLLDLAYDAFNHVIYTGGLTSGIANVRFGKYDPASDTFTDLTSKITPSWGTTGYLYALFYDSFTHTIYAGGRNGLAFNFRFGKYDPASDTFTDLTSKITSSPWGATGNIFKFSYDSFTHTIYAGGYDNSAPALFRFGKYDPASVRRDNNASLFEYLNDAPLFLDATGYAAVAASDDVYDSITTTMATTGLTTSFPMFVFKAKDTSAGQTPLTNVITLTWEGQSSTSQKSTASTTLEIFNNSTLSWEILASNTTKAKNTDFTLSALIQANQADYFDSVTTIYVRVAQNVSSTSTRSEPLGLRTDLFSAVFAQPTAFTQRAALFENDNGLTPDANTITASGSPALTVEKGQRFVLRFQVDNTGTASTVNLGVQFNRQGETAWNPVTSGEVSISPGISGSEGDALSSAKANSGACQSGLGLSFTNGTWHENATTTGFFALGPTQCTEVGFIFSTATAVAGTTYNFKLVSVTSVLAINSSATPTITIANPPTKKFSKTGLGWDPGAAFTDSRDLGYYLDATGYAAVVTDDTLYDIATSTVGIPSFVFKVRDPNQVNSDSIEVTWKGQSSQDASIKNIRLDLWDNVAVAWETVSTNIWTAANQEFTFANSRSGTKYFDSGFNVYIRVRHMATGAIGLKTNLISFNFPPPITRQRAFIFENDNGSTPDTNTIASSNILVVEKGQRFTVRFQIDNTGSVVTRQYQVQYTYDNLGSFKTVTSGQIALSFGISGSDGDALTSQKAGTCQGGTTFQNGEWHENTALTTEFALDGGRCTEFAWILSSASSVTATSYKFRILDATIGDVIQGYTATPVVSIVPVQNRKHSKTGLLQERNFLASNANDMPYYLDATGYAAVALDDGVYDSATSTVGNYPISIFKIRNPNGNNTDIIALKWNGMSNVAPSSATVTSWLWSNTLSVWIPVTSNNFTAANTEFTFTTATSGAQFYDSNNTVAFRIDQAAGTEALKTDIVSMAFDAALTQRAALFENDNGNTPDTNTRTASGSPALTMEKGQRFLLRFQVDNTGVSTNTRFVVQFDHNDGVYKTVTSGEIAASPGISGINGDALTLNRNNACSGDTAFVNGAWHEDTATTNYFMLEGFKCTEFGFMLSTATATVGATYNFRLVTATSYLPFNSVATPTLTIVNPQNRIYSKNGLTIEYAALSTLSDDLPYYLDATGYAAVVADDQIYDTATSTGSNVPMSIFKIRNTSGDTTAAINFTWNGQSNVAPQTASVTSWLWSPTKSLWIPVTSNNFTVANTDFTFTSVTAGAPFYDANNFVYLRVAQAAGAEALRTDYVTMSFGGYLHQRAYIFENDNGTSVESNTTSTNATLTAEKGQRFIARFQVENRGPATSTQYAVQFDHASDGNFKTVTSGEIAISLGLSGTNSSTLTTTKAGACATDTPFQNGSWYEDSATSSDQGLDNSRCTELGFIFSTATATVGTTYRMRLYNVRAGKALEAYTAYPTLTIVSAQAIKHSKGAFNAYDGFVSPLGYALNSTDLEYYLDASGYKAVAYTDNIFDTATSSATSVNYGSASASTTRPSFVFKIQNARGNNSDKILFNWSGQSTTTALPIAVQVYKYSGTATGWITVTTVRPRATYTTISATATIFSNEMPDYYTTNNFTAWRVMQSNPAYNTSATWGLLTDIATTTFSVLNLAQRGYLFENDDASTVNTNSSVTSENFSVSSMRRGTRFNLRVQLDNTGSNGITLYQRNVKLQYAPDGDIGCDTIDPIRWTDAGNGLSSTTPAFITVSSSIAVSLANSFAVNDAVNTSKISGNGNTRVDGLAVENTYRTDAATLGNAQYTEHVFSLQTGEAPPTTTSICFRAVLEGFSTGKTATSEPFTTYAKYPKVYLTPAANQIQRFSKGAQQVFSDMAFDARSSLASFWGTVNGNALSYDAYNRMVYLLGDSGAFARYDPATNTATDLSGTVSASWSGVNGRALAYDTYNRMVYLLGNSGKFARYDPSTNIATDLTGRIATFWGTNNGLALGYDIFTRTVYLLGDNGVFGRYDPATHQATNLTSRIVDDFGAVPGNALTYDSFNHVWYLFGGVSGIAVRFVKYDPASDLETDLTGLLLVPWGSNAGRAVSYDAFNRRIYLLGESGLFWAYQTHDGVAIDLTQKIASFWGTQQGNALVYDTFHHATYLLGASRQFAKYDDAQYAAGENSATGTATDLSLKLNWGIISGNALTYDTVNHAMYLLGNTGFFTRHDPDLARNHDNLLFFDNSDYVGTATSDNIRASVTAGPTTGSATFYAAMLFKIRNTETTNGPDIFTVTWEGQSSTSATSVLLQVYDHDVFEGGATSTTAWKTIATATAASFSVDTDMRLEVTVNGDYPVVGSTVTRYFSRHQNGVDPLATSTVILRVIQQSMATSLSPITLRTDVLCVNFGAQQSCSPPPAAPPATPDLTQTASLFENDNGSNVDTNTLTATGFPALTVEKGQRFIARFQILNGAGSATTAQFNLQFDHNDGTWKTVTSGEISTSLGLSGQDGDSLTSAKLSGGCVFNNGRWHENTATSQGIFIPDTQCTEVAFMLNTATAVVNTTYRMRLVTATSNRAFTYNTNYPTLTITGTQSRKHSKGAFQMWDGNPANPRYPWVFEDSDLEYYLDATGYQAVAFADNFLDSATSTATSVNFGSATSATTRPSFLFKIRNPRTTADKINFAWVGQTTTTALPIAFQVFKYGNTSLTNSATGWITVTTVKLNSTAMENTSFGVTSTVFSNTMADYYTTVGGNTFTTWRVMQSHSGQNDPTPFALKTDLATTTFASVNLTQAGFLFESDDGLNPDQNTTTGSINTMLQGVRRGERFNLRISVSSVSDVAVQSKIFKLQYAATSTNAISTSAGCALFATSSPAWIDVGIGATSNIPNVATSVSPTSVNFSLADSFEQGLAVSAPKLTSAGANFQNGHAIENSAQSNPYTLQANKGTELVYAIQTGETMPAAKVCFRLVLEENGDTKNGRVEPLSTYTQYPALSIRTYAENTQRFSKGVQRYKEDTFIATTTIPVTWGATVRYLTYDSFNHVAFFGSSTANKFGKYDPASDTFTDLSSRIAAFGTTLEYLTYDSFNHLVFFGSFSDGSTSKLGKYDPSSDTFTDLSSRVSSFGAPVQYLTYDSFNHLVFFSGSSAYSNKLGKYDPASDTFTNLSNKITWASAAVAYLIYDSFNHLVFFGSGGASNNFGKYDPASDTFTDLSSRISGSWGSNTVRYLTYDSFNHLVFFGSSVLNNFGKYDPASDVFTDLTSKITWGVVLQFLTYDSFNHLIFFGSNASNKFAKYDPASDTFTDLSGKVSSYGAVVQYLTYDSFNHQIISGSGSTGKLARFNPSLSKTTDNLLFFDEKDYAGVQTAGDNLFSSVTSYSNVSTPSNVTSYPSFLFKQKLDHIGDRITVTWTGQTTTTVQPVYLQVYDHNVIEGVATSTTAWKTIAFRSATSINSNFTLSGTITNDFPVPGAASTTRYFIKHQNGVDPLATTTIMLRVYQEHQTIGNEIPGPVTLKTDSFAVTQDQPTLVQTAVLWENDDGTTPDNNTVTTGPASPSFGTPSSVLLGVRRGERLNLRFQIANTGTIAIANKVLKLQYHATSVNALTLDCATANPTASSTWYDVGDGGPANNPNVPTSVSPTSVNYSLANSGDLADAVSANKLPAPYKNDGVTLADFQNGFFNDNSPRTATGVTIDANKYTELVFPVHLGDTMASSSICFRLVSETDQGTDIANPTAPVMGTLDRYQVYAKIGIRTPSENTQRFSKGVQRTGGDLVTNNIGAISSFWGTNTVTALAYDTFNHIVYLLGANATFAKYDPVTDGAVDLSGRISSFWGAQAGRALAYDTFNHAVYLFGDNGKFAKYDLASDAAVNLASRISSFWGAQAGRALAYDTFNHAVYLFGDNGKFAKYDPITDVATDLSATISSIWEGTIGYALAYDSFNHAVYLGGGNGFVAPVKFAKYDPASGAVTDLSNKLSFFLDGSTTGEVDTLTYDSSSHSVYAMGYVGGKFAKYNPATDTVFDISGSISSFWSSNIGIALSYDAFNHAVYLGGAGSKFAKYDPAKDVGTYLTNKISFWGVGDDVNALTYDSFNHVIYLGGSSGNFARFNPSLSKNTDNLLFFDEKDYASSATSDNAYVSVTAGPSTISVTSYATMLFKIKNPTPAPAESMRIEWEGQSSTSATSILFQIFDHEVSASSSSLNAESSTAWKTIASATAGSFSVDTDVRLSAIVNSTYPDATAASTSKYFAKHQSGVDPLATSTVVLRVIQQSMATSLSPITLRTDTVCITFANAGETPGACLAPVAGAANTTLTQSLFRFYENVDGITPSDPWPDGATDLAENEWIGSTGTPPITGTSVRLRVQIDVSGADLGVSATTFRLQAARVGVEGFRSGDTASSCAAVPSADWQNIGDTASTTAEWRGYDNASPADNATLTTLRLSGSDVAGTYEETLDTSSSTPANPNAVTAGQQVEYDFVVQNNRARGGGEYCFRVVQSVSGVSYPLNGGYSVYPRVHVNEELTFSLDDSTVTFGMLDASNNFTAVTSTTSTISTNAASGYVIRAWSTQRMTHANLAQYTVADWPGTNNIPTTWTGNCITNTQCGFGYSTDDATLTGGDADRFTATKSYAGFTHGDQDSNGDPVGDGAGFASSAKTQIDYRISVNATQAAGVYNTTVVYIATPTF